MVVKKETKNNELGAILDNLSFATLGRGKNIASGNSVFGKEVLGLNAFENNRLAKSYWKLDGHAFDDQPAPIFMKLDTFILGGLPVTIGLSGEEVETSLLEEIDAEGLEYVPIGFMDMHMNGEKEFTVSGLGIAPEYQGRGLSKYLIYGGAKISGAQKLTIPTQLSNAQAHYGWLHLAPLKIASLDVFHNEADTIVYDASIPQTKEDILSPLGDRDLEGELVPFSELEFFVKEGFSKVVGYSEEGLYLENGK
mgnify:CR=1 FL=1